jgi:hypothetical protein
MTALPARQSNSQIVGNDAWRDQQNTQREQRESAHTWGCLSPIDIQPMDALLDDIKRTQAHILWLEQFIAGMPAHGPFTAKETNRTLDKQQGRMGSVSVVGSVRWRQQMEALRESRSQTDRPGTHPAITQLQSERRHLADTCYKAVMLGIKLDAIDYSRMQADLIIQSMHKFAINNQLDPTNKDIAQSITDALNQVLAEQAERA